MINLIQMISTVVNLDLESSHVCVPACVRACVWMCVGGCMCICVCAWSVCVRVFLCVLI